MEAKDSWIIHDISQCILVCAQCALILIASTVLASTVPLVPGNGVTAKKTEL